MINRFEWEGLSSKEKEIINEKRRYYLRLRKFLKKGANEDD